MPKTCMLFQGNKPHTAHKIFGDSVDSTYRHFETGRSIDTHPSNWNPGITARIRTARQLSTEFDLIVAEGSAPLQTALVYGAIRNRSATIVYLAADDTFYTLDQRSSRFIWQAFKPVVSSTLNGCIAVSDLAVDWCDPYLSPKRTKIVHPPVGDEAYDKLSKLNSHSPSKPFNILSVGDRRTIKNYESLVTAVGELSSIYDRDVKLTLVGRNHENATYSEESYVELPGYISTNDLVPLYHNASVYIQPSIADAYPVASLEAMLSATPTIVAENVGTAHRLPSEHICSPVVEDIRRTVETVMNKPRSERQNVGQDHRHSVINITESNQEDDFRSSILSIYDSVNESKI